MHSIFLYDYRKIEVCIILLYRTMPGSMIFVTLSGGPYADAWIDKKTLRWCGQESGKEDNLVVPGTQIWLREKSSHMFFDHVGNVGSIEQVRPNDPLREKGDRHAVYTIAVDEVKPLRISRTEGDIVTHWAVLRHLGVNERGSAHFPRGIYAI